MGGEPHKFDIITPVIGAGAPLSGDPKIISTNSLPRVASMTVAVEMSANVSWVYVPGKSVPLINVRVIDTLLSSNVRVSTVKLPEIVSLPTGPSPKGGPKVAEASAENEYVIVAAAAGAGAARVAVATTANESWRMRRNVRCLFKRNILASLLITQKPNELILVQKMLAAR
jgi:hypothetical protein